VVKIYELQTASRRLRGQAHPRATLTDHEVELMRELHEHLTEPWGYRRLAAKFETPRATVVAICQYRRR
jgi:hypothetical protein